MFWFPTLLHWSNDLTWKICPILGLASSSVTLGAHVSSDCFHETIIQFFTYKCWKVPLSLFCNLVFTQWPLLGSQGPGWSEMLPDMALVSQRLSQNCLMASLKPFTHLSLPSAQPWPFIPLHYTLLPHLTYKASGLNCPESHKRIVNNEEIKAPFQWFPLPSFLISFAITTMIQPSLWAILQKDESFTLSQERRALCTTPSLKI